MYIWYVEYEYGLGTSKSYTKQGIVINNTRDLADIEDKLLSNYPQRKFLDITYAEFLGLGEDLST